MRLFMCSNNAPSAHNTLYSRVRKTSPDALTHARAKLSGSAPVHFLPRAQQRARRLDELVANNSPRNARVTSAIRIYRRAMPLSACCGTYATHERSSMPRCTCNYADMPRPATNAYPRLTQSLHMNGTNGVCTLGD